jgi:hypothetical protein
MMGSLESEGEVEVGEENGNGGAVAGVNVCIC